MRLSHSLSFTDTSSGQVACLCICVNWYFCCLLLKHLRQNKYAHKKKVTKFWCQCNLARNPPSERRPCHPGTWRQWCISPTCHPVQTRTPLWSSSSKVDHSTWPAETKFKLQQQQKYSSAYPLLTDVLGFSERWPKVKKMFHKSLKSQSSGAVWQSMGSPSLTVLLVSVDVKQHWNELNWTLTSQETVHILTAVAPRRTMVQAWHTTANSPLLAPSTQHGRAFKCAHKSWVHLLTFPSMHASGCLPAHRREYGVVHDGCVYILWQQIYHLWI